MYKFLFFFCFGFLNSNLENIDDSNLNSSSECKFTEQNMEKLNLCFSNLKDIYAVNAFFCCSQLVEIVALPFMYTFVVSNRLPNKGELIRFLPICIIYCFFRYVNLRMNESLFKQMEDLEKNYL